MRLPSLAGLGRAAVTRSDAPQTAAAFQLLSRVETPSSDTKGGCMYIGGGLLTLIVIILLLIWLL
jgi:flagellar biogenesis protein FliO